MDNNAGMAFSHSADYMFIETALQTRWIPFRDLEAELVGFVPRSLSDFLEFRSAELIRLRALNPESSDESLLELIDGQIQARVDPRVQIHFQFADRVMSEYVTVAFLAHALAEATINAILAIGLAASGSHDLFALIERADIKEKWLVGPKAFHAPYVLPKGAALYDTLQHLTKQRNAFIHYKIELEMEGKKKLEGSRLDRAPLHEQVKWIRRFFSLPYDLAAHAREQIPGHLGLFLHDSGPIERFRPHTER